MTYREELYRIANHIASAKGALPDEWQPWADEIESDLRKLVSRERDKQEPAPQLKNLEHFIAFWRKVQGGTISPSKNEIDHTVWFMEGLADIAAPPAPVVPECFARFHEVVKERHHGRMPEEVQKAFDECATMLKEDK